MNIRLCEMTIPLMRQFFQSFEYDQSTFEDPEDCIEYQYSVESADAFYKKHQKTDRKHFAILLDNQVVGDLYLKQMKLSNQSCTMSIHMKNDSVKNKGYGTKAVLLALKYAFEELLMENVYADALIKNNRSRHVLTKAGFQEIKTDDKCCYYIFRKADWSYSLSVQR